MAFNMNKPIIKGTKKHSAILAKAEEMVRTHGMDPVLGPAAAAYGDSMSSPDVIDYHIKSREIEWDKKEKGEKTEKETTTTTTNNIIERRIQIAEIDSTKAENIVKETIKKNKEKEDPVFKKETRKEKRDRKRSEKKALEELNKSQIDLSIKSEPYDPSDVKIDWDALEEKEKEDVDDFPKWVNKPIPPSSIEGGLDSGPTHPMPSDEEFKNMTDQEKEIWLKEGTIPKKKVEKKVEKKKVEKKKVEEKKVEEKKVEEKKVKPPTTTKPTVKRNVALEVKYKNSSTWVQKQMRKNRPNYPWPK